MATSQLWTKQSESTDTEKQDLENYQNDKISDDYEDESPLYLPKNISNLTDPTYKNSYYFWGWSVDLARIYRFIYLINKF